jgi:hypothetical protein
MIAVDKNGNEVSQVIIDDHANAETLTLRAAGTATQDFLSTMDGDEVSAESLRRTLQ